MLAVLDAYASEKQTAKQVELWRMRKGEREVCCVVVYTPVGTDLRLLERGEMLRTELIRDALLLEPRLKYWQRTLVATGWRLAEFSSAAQEELV
jgi:hypothetical protein